MNINLFDFYLPEELIAQRPVDKRDESRLLAVNLSYKIVLYLGLSESFNKRISNIPANSVYIILIKFVPIKPLVPVINSCFIKVTRNKGTFCLFFCHL